MSNTIFNISEGRQVEMERGKYVLRNQSLKVKIMYFSGAIAIKVRRASSVTSMVHGCTACARLISDSQRAGQQANANSSRLDSLDTKTNQLAPSFGSRAEHHAPSFEHGVSPAILVGLLFNDVGW